MMGAQGGETPESATFLAHFLQYSLLLREDEAVLPQVDHAGYV